MKTESIPTTTVPLSKDHQVELELWVRTAFCLKNKVEENGEEHAEQSKDPKQWVELCFCKSLLYLAIQQTRIKSQY